MIESMRLIYGNLTFIQNRCENFDESPRSIESPLRTCTRKFWKDLNLKCIVIEASLRLFLIQRGKLLFFGEEGSTMVYDVTKSSVIQATQLLTTSSISIMPPSVKSLKSICSEKALTFLSRVYRLKPYFLYRRETKRDNRLRRKKPNHLK